MSKLTDIVKEMKDKVRTNGYEMAMLPRGLRVAIYEREDDMVLVLQRYDAIPGTTEIKILKRAFFGDTPLKVIDHPNAINVDGVGCCLYEKRKVYLAIKRG
jgi:hypothetical protein